MSFDPSKPVQTRDGRPARIICTDAKGPRVMVALVDCSTHEEARAYYSNGSRSNGMSFVNQDDLVNTPETKSLKRWLNVDEDGTVKAYASRQYADEWASDDRVACLLRTFEYKVGDGLEGSSA